jgi:hypothetical protein
VMIVTLQLLVFVLVVVVVPYAVLLLDYILVISNLMTVESYSILIPR